MNLHSHSVVMFDQALNPARSGKSWILDAETFGVVGVEVKVSGRVNVNGEVQCGPVFSAHWPCRPLVCVASSLSSQNSLRRDVGEWSRYGGLRYRKGHVTGGRSRFARSIMSKSSRRVPASAARCFRISSERASQSPVMRDHPY